MKQILTLCLAFLLIALNFSGQILSSDPPFPTQTDQITIFYDATLGNADLTGVIPVYAHTGVITNFSTSNSDWQNVQGNWGTADPNVIMTPLGNNIHKIVITPQTYYNLNVGETVSKLAFVFRNQNGSLVGRNADGSDIYLDIYAPGFNAGISSPGLPSQIVDPNQVVPIVCGSSAPSDITIYVNGTEVSNVSNDISLTYNFSSSTPGEYVVSMLADDGTTQITDETLIIILPSANVASAPSGTIDGINVVNSTTVRLQLYAPNKDYVFVIGDFNNWQLDLDYFMNVTPDGSTYWLDIPGLDPNTEYRFQYYIDAEGMRVADVYADKILDFWNDPWIPEETYPNLIDYPTGLTSDAVSVLKINPDPFTWTDGSFVRPPQERLLIYELHVRDFLENSNYQTLQDTLDYIENLGVTAIHIMPINEFEGNNSWGYNPSFYFAPDKAYGTKTALKSFINECHLRGIAVIQDIVLNHSFGQSPMVRMYFNPDAGQYGQPTAENPWFNQVPKHDFNVGYDFNHESTRTRNFCKRVLGYWLTEFHMDGYRFDLSKGFTQNNTLGNTAAFAQYDQSRIDIINDYHNHMLATSPGSYMVLEHFADNSEESVLASNGIMLWGNMSDAYEEGSMGYNSDFTWGSYQARGWSAPGLVSYAESHDEERMMYKNINFGNSNGAYDVQDLNTALKRQELAHCLLIPIPGPHLMWQFGELGYDYSIFTCSDGVTISANCRTDAKPVRWDYRDVANRLYVYKVISAINKLKKTQQTFSTPNFTTDLSGFGKRIILDGTSMDAVVVGNFNVIGINMVPGFTHTGMWYDYFTGTSFNVTDLSTSFSYTAGEYHIYTDMQLALPDLNVSVSEVLNFSGSSLVAYPNPANDILNIGFKLNAPGKIRVQLLDLMGRTVAVLSDKNTGSGTQSLQINLNEHNLSSGTYILQVMSSEGNLTQALVLNR